MENEFDFNAAAEEIFSNESQAEATNENSLEGQAQNENPETTEAQEVSPKDILEQVAKEKDPGIDPAILDQINGLNMVHNNLPIKIDSPEMLKELIQKGFDYTKKSMAREEEFRTKSEEFTAKEQQFVERETQLVQKEQQLADTVMLSNNMKSILGRIQKNDPELFEHLDQMYRDEEETLSKNAPIMAKYEGELSKLKDEINGIKTQKQTEELSQIKNGWEKELGETQTKHVASLTKLGVKVDWEKVKSAWTADVSNKLSVEDALFASHGKEIHAANESYKKLLTTKNKTQSSMLARGGASGGAGKQPETIKYSPGNYEAILKDVADNF